MKLQIFRKFDELISLSIARESEILFRLRNILCDVVQFQESFIEFRYFIGYFLDIGSTDSAPVSFLIYF